MKGGGRLVLWTAGDMHPPQDTVNENAGSKIIICFMRLWVMFEIDVVCSQM